MAHAGRSERQRASGYDAGPELGQRWRSSGSVKSQQHDRSGTGNTLRKSCRNLNQLDSEGSSGRTLLSQIGQGAAKFVRSVYGTKRGAELGDVATIENGSFRVLEQASSGPSKGKKSIQELEIEQRLRRSKRRVLPSARYRAPELERACDGLDLDQLEAIKRDNLRLTLRQVSLRAAKVNGCSCGSSLAKDCSCSNRLSSNDKPQVGGQIISNNKQEYPRTSRAMTTDDDNDDDDDKLKVLSGKICADRSSTPPSGRLSLGEQRTQDTEEERERGGVESSGGRAQASAQQANKSSSVRDAIGAIESKLDLSRQQVGNRGRRTPPRAPVDQNLSATQTDKQSRILTGTEPDEQSNDSYAAMDSSVAFWPSEIVSRYGENEEHLYATICSSLTPSPEQGARLRSRHQDHNMRHPECHCRRLDTDMEQSEQQNNDRHMFSKQLEAAELAQIEPKRQGFLGRLKQLISRPGKSQDESGNCGNKKTRTRSTYRAHTISSKSGQKLLMHHVAPPASYKCVETAEAGELSGEKESTIKGRKSFMNGFLTIGRLQGARSMSSIKHGEHLPVSELFKCEPHRVRPRRSNKFGSVDSLPSADSGLSCSNLQTNSSSCDENYPTLAAAKSTSNLYSHGPYEAQHFQSSEPSIENLTLITGDLCNQAAVGRARAKVDCNPCAYDKEALVFKRGDLIDILERDQSGTWIGRCNGQVGHFKFINVDELEEEQEEQEEEEEANSFAEESATEMDKRPFVTKLEIRSSKREFCTPEQLIKNRRSISLETVKVYEDARGDIATASEHESVQRLASSNETIMSSLEQLLFAIGLAGEQVVNLDHANKQFAHSDSNPTGQSYLDVLNKGGINNLDSFSTIDKQQELEQIGIVDDEHQRRLLMAAKIIRQASQAAKLDFVENYQSRSRLETNRYSNSNDGHQDKALARQSVQAQPATNSGSQSGQVNRSSNIKASNCPETNRSSEANEPIYVNLLGARNLEVHSVGESIGLIADSTATYNPQTRAHDPSADHDQSNIARDSSRRHSHSCSPLLAKGEPIDIGQQMANQEPARRKLFIAARSTNTKPETHDREKLAWSSNTNKTRSSSHNSVSEQINHQHQQQHAVDADHYHLSSPTKIIQASRLEFLSPEILRPPIESQMTCYYQPTNNAISCSSDEDEDECSRKQHTRILASDSFDSTVESYDVIDCASRSNRLNRGYSKRVTARRRGVGLVESDTQNFHTGANFDTPKSYSDGRGDRVKVSQMSSPIRMAFNDQARKQMEIAPKVEGIRRRQAYSSVSRANSNHARQVLPGCVKINDGHHRVNHGQPNIQHNHNHDTMMEVKPRLNCSPVYHIYEDSSRTFRDIKSGKQATNHMTNMHQQQNIVVPKLRSQINSSKSAYDLRLDLSHFFS